MAESVARAWAKPTAPQLSSNHWKVISRRVLRLFNFCSDEAESIIILCNDKSLRQLSDFRRDSMSSCMSQVLDSLATLSISRLQNVFSCYRLPISFVNPYLPGTSILATASYLQKIFSPTSKPLSVASGVSGASGQCPTSPLMTKHTVRLKGYSPAVDLALHVKCGSGNRMSHFHCKGSSYRLVEATFPSFRYPLTCSFIQHQRSLHLSDTLVAYVLHMCTGFLQ